MYAAEVWALTERLEELLRSCDHRVLRYMSRVIWQDMVTNEEAYCVIDNCIL